MSILFKDTQTNYCKKQTKNPPQLYSIYYMNFYEMIWVENKSSRNVLARDNQQSIPVRLKESNLVM